MQGEPLPELRENEKLTLSGVEIKQVSFKVAGSCAHNLTYSKMVGNAYCLITESLASLWQASWKAIEASRFATNME